MNVGGKCRLTPSPWLLLGFVVASFAPAAENASTVPSEYKSVRCTAGEVFLILERDGDFVLGLERGAEAPLLRMQGKWKEAERDLTLEAPEGKLVYRREPVRFTIGDHRFELAGLGWQKSAPATFADECPTLVDRIGLERAVHRFAPAPPSAP